MDNLTNEELDRISSMRINVEEMALEEPVWRSKPLLQRTERELPLEHRAASESFLVAELEGRARLSRETRLREEERLASRLKKRKRHTGASRGRRHWKRKEQTKQRKLDRLYDRDAYQWFKYGIKLPLRLTRQEWDRWLKPVFEEYPRGSLKWKRPDNTRAFSVYNLILTYHPLDSRGKPKKPIQVYDGRDSMMWDAQDAEWKDRVDEEIRISLR